MHTHDVIILGLGGMGSAALYHLAKRGLRVLGIEQFGIAHDRGSSHGQTRIIRKAYFEHPAYVPLVESAYRYWFELEGEAGVKLFHRTGLMLAGPADGAIISGVRRATREHQLNVETLTASEARRRFAGLAPSDDMTVLFEPEAGYLLVERCVEVYVERARAQGAEIVTGECVRGWTSDGSGVRVTTQHGSYTAGKLVICAGPWTASLLGHLGLPLEIRRKVVVWFATQNECYRPDRGFPIFGFETGGSFFFGFPMDARGVKTCDHFGGETTPTANSLDRTLHEADVEHLRHYVRQFLPGVTGEVTGHSVCMYTMTPDEHFIVDRYPSQDNVFFAAGFSGHGFKFASVIGSILGDMVTEGGTKEPVDFLRLNRPALWQPGS